MGKMNSEVHPHMALLVVEVEDVRSSEEENQRDEN